MANELQELMDTLIMPAALPVLREACVMPALVNTDFSAEAAQQNETIRVPGPQDLGEADDMDTTNGSSSTDLSDNKVDLKLDQWKYKQFEMNDKEMREAMTGGILPSAADSAVKSLANAVNASLLGLYKDIPYSAGTAGETPSTSRQIIDVRKVLQDNLAPLSDRRLVLDTEGEAAYLDLYKDADATGSTEALINASLGRKFGFETFADQMMPRHTIGAWAGASVAVNGAVPAGAKVMNVDGMAGTETIAHGDTFTVAGAVDAKGRPMQFVVTAAAVAVGGAAQINFYPAAPEGGFADDSGVDVTAPASGNDYSINLAFNRNAFVFAARTLSNENSENSTISVATDPVSGVPLRLETWREPGKAKRYWRFDILYGTKTLREELAARLHG